jgi:Ca2+-binding EF-hand superfamily protein
MKQFSGVKAPQAWLFGALMAVAALGSVAHAQEGSQRAEGKPKAMKLDANGDGLISRDEAKGHERLEKSFERLDANKDGLLSRDELAAARTKLREQRHGHKPAEAAPK